MRQSPKQNRMRHKNGRKPSGPSVNRVYESAGPEGKVRGTPQQIIEKYQALARDKATSGDRVLSEGYLQHAEHYIRLLISAQQHTQKRDEREVEREVEPEAPVEAGADEMAAVDASEDMSPSPPQPSVADGMAVIGDADASESSAPETFEPAPKRRMRRPARRPRDPEAAEEADAPSPELADDAHAPKPRRRTTRPRKPAPPADQPLPFDDRDQQPSAGAPNDDDPAVARAAG